MGEQAAVTKTSGNKGKVPVSSKPKENLSQAKDSTAAQMHHLQQTLGNQAVRRLINSGTLQAKLTIGQPNDKYEQEADRVADRVMSMPEPKQSLVQRQASPEEEEDVQRQPGEEVEDETIQRKGATPQSQTVSPTIESRIQSFKGGGQPLSKSTREYFEPRFNQDFSRVRIHEGSQAAETAKSINAKAFTTGKDVVFGAGQYSPGTSTGKRLLAHELTHVVQQKKVREGGGVENRHSFLTNSAFTGKGESEKNIPKFTEGRQRTQELRQQFPGIGLRLDSLRVQRAVMIRKPVTTDPTSKEAKNEIERAKQLLSDSSLDPVLRQYLQTRINKAEAALKAYRKTIKSGSADMNPMAATTTTGINPAGAIAALLVLMAGWLVTANASRSRANSNAAKELANSLKSLAYTVSQLEIVIFMAASVAERHIKGAKRVIDTHINKIKNPDPHGGPPYIPKWLKDIRKHLRNILKHAKKLKGKKRDDVLKYVKETANSLRELAKKHNIPWEF